MSRRGWKASLALAMLTIIALWSSSLILSAPMLQIDPTQQQQTIDAIVQQRFQQTAVAQQQLGATQTIDAAFNQALTGTAGFNATVNAAFANAASATAGVPFTQAAATDFMVRTQTAATAFAGQTRIAATAVAASATANVLNAQIAATAFAVQTRIARTATAASATAIILNTQVAATNIAVQTQVAATSVVGHLIRLESDIVGVQGGTFEMGTTPAEVSAAVQECNQGYGGDIGNCDVSMGEDAYPQHQVTVSTFYIERTEVTYAQFLAFMNALGPGSDRNGCDGGQPCMQTRTESETSNVQFDGANYSVPVVINDYPMADVTWYGADAYCKAIGRRLPTEAEWELAARGTADNIYPWGNSWDATKASTIRPASGQPSTVPVTSFPDGASPSGALNMAGNVAEWVSDWYDPQFYSRPEATVADPTGPASGTEKVVRGGSWNDLPFFSRTVQRVSHSPLQPAPWIGFRCAG